MPDLLAHHIAPKDLVGELKRELAQRKRTLARQQRDGRGDRDRSEYRIRVIERLLGMVAAALAQRGE